MDDSVAVRRRLDADDAFGRFICPIIAPSSVVFPDGATDHHEGQPGFDDVHDPCGTASAAMAPDSISERKSLLAVLQDHNEIQVRRRPPADHRGAPMAVTASTTLDSWPSTQGWASSRRLPALSAGHREPPDCRFVVEDDVGAVQSSPGRPIPGPVCRTSTSAISGSARKLFGISPAPVSSVCRCRNATSRSASPRDPAFGADRRGD